MVKIIFLQVLTLFYPMVPSFTKNNHIISHNIISNLIPSNFFLPARLFDGKKPAQLFDCKNHFLQVFTVIYPILQKTIISNLIPSNFFLPARLFDGKKPAQLFDGKNHFLQVLTLIYPMVPNFTKNNHIISYPILSYQI